MSAQLLTGWGRTAPTRADVLEVRSAGEVAEALAGGRGAIARGLGRAYGDAAQNAGGLVIDTRAMRRVLSLEDGVIEAEAGLDLDTLIADALPRGWFVPVTPGTRHVTLGGALAADVHGKNHHVDGAFSRHVESFELVTPGGGPVTVRPGDDLFAATAGGMGLTGVITRVRLRLLPVTSAWMRVTTTRARDLGALIADMRERDHLFRYSVAWIDTLHARGRGILLRGEHAEAGELDGRDPLAYRAPQRLSVPDVVPSGLLNTAVARAFNAVWYAKAPKRERVGLEGIAPYFHPLDAVGAWNRLYGRRGFVQYQAVVPEDDALGELLDRVRSTGSFLAVLKRFGEGTGLLSFPMRGWTLALDIPAGAPGLAGVLDALDEVVVAAGGRVYLAKDARVRPELLERMYPELDAWREIRRAADPGGVMQSDLGRRLGL